MSTYEDSSDVEELFEIELILAKRTRKGKVQYYVKWAGYDIDDSTWEDESALVSAQEAVHTFESEHGNNVGNIPQLGANYRIG